MKSLKVLLERLNLFVSIICIVLFFFPYHVPAFDVLHIQLVIMEVLLRLSLEILRKDRRGGGLWED